jgi:hypothetical protein
MLVVPAAPGAVVCPPAPPPADKEIVGDMGGTLMVEAVPLVPLL